MNTLIMNEMIYSLQQRNEDEWEEYVPCAQQIIGPESVLMWANWSGRMDDDGRWEPSYLEEAPAEGPFAGLQRLADLMGGYRSDFQITFKLPPLKRITCCDVDW